MIHLRGEMSLLGCCNFLQKSFLRVASFLFGMSNKLRRSICHTMSSLLKRYSQGSVLAYSLILLGIVLVASVGMMSASVTDLRSISSSDKSVNAFQIADSGSQAAIRLLKNTPGGTLKSMIEPTTSCPNGNTATVESGTFLGGNYRVIFLDDAGQALKCSDDVSKVVSVKSVGTYSDTVRAVQVAAASAPKPIGWWKFNDGSGLTVVNEMSSNGSGTFGGSPIPTWTGGSPNYSVDFGGTGGEVSMADESDFDLKRTISISLWFRVDTLPAGSGWAPLVSKMDSLGSIASRNYSVWLNGLGFVHLASANSSGVQSCSDTNNVIATGAWYHYVGVIDRNTGTMTRYINGVLASPGSAAYNCVGAGAFTPGEDAIGNNDPVKVGGSFGSYGVFDGTIDDVRIYDDVLTASDVASLYNGGSGRE